MSNKIYILDTTLRDGEQTPSVSLNFREKLEIAQQLAKLNVDIIEAGFPISSPGDMDAVKTIARLVKGPAISGLSRLNKKDIDAVKEALAEAEAPRIHVFIATSDVHMQYKLKMTREEVLAAVREKVSYARNLFEYVEFSGEDAFRSDPDFLAQVYQAAIEAGARILNVPDTVGYALPSEFGAFIKNLREGVPDADKGVWSVHCHNDLGLAVANSLTSIENGVRQVECTINGLGERAGNTSLEEIVMALETRKNHMQFETGINIKEIGRSSRLVSNLSGIPIQPNKAIVGKNAFLHESGIHQDGVLKMRSTYEIMDPKELGLFSDNLVMGKHSGRHGFKEYLENLGFNVEENDLDIIFKNFKSLADRKKTVTDRDIEVLVEEQIRAIEEHWKLEYFQISSGTGITPTATVRLSSEQEVRVEASCGEGPVSAIFNAIDKCANVRLTLNHYSLNAVTGGNDAIGEVLTQIEYMGRSFNGRGISTDILEASAKSYVNAINRAIYECEHEDCEDETIILGGNI